MVLDRGLEPRDSSVLSEVDIPILLIEHEFGERGESRTRTPMGTRV